MKDDLEERKRRLVIGRKCDERNVQDEAANRITEFLPHRWQVGPAH